MASVDKDLVDYYSARAAEYEEIYCRAERQDDLTVLRAIVEEFAAGHRLLELACGTGYWTQVVARSAALVVAVDPSVASIERARSKNIAPEKVTFEIADASGITSDLDAITALACGFLWSHIPRQEIRSWVRQLVGMLPAGCGFLFMDNRFVEGSSTPISATDHHGNTLQRRELTDGRSFEIIKNFPSPPELRRAIQGVARDVRINELEYFWVLQFTS